jgi:hypothetical protein
MHGIERSDIYLGFDWGTCVHACEGRNGMICTRLVTGAHPRAIVVLFQGEFDADIYKHNYTDIIYRANCIIPDRSLAAYVLVCTYIYTNKEAYC